jgi:hypothetical protein
MQEAPLPEVIILRDDCESLGRRMPPDSVILRLGQPDIAHVHRIRI